MRNGFLFTLAALAGLIAGGCGAAGPEQTSGGPLLPEQAAYDVTFYDLALRVDPEARAIRGALTVHARVVDTLSWLVLDLDQALAVEAVDRLGDEEQRLPVERRGGRLWIALPEPARAGDSLVVRVRYGGQPRTAPHPPWDGGFTWAQTATGAPWIGVSCQAEGADLWWPCKDHPSDEPDSMALHITVPDSLVAAANGRLRRVTEGADHTRTYHWFVSTPINNYGVTLNIAPYDTLTTRYTSVAGDSFPVTFWVLPERLDDARALFPHLIDQLRFLEATLGPYPFRADKYGIAHTPYLGMEHQTIIAYGDQFQKNTYGFDWLHLHELAHEWFANLVTASDWRDLWLHEGFATYLEALYAEHLNGPSSYHAYMADLRPRIRNAKPLAPAEPRSSKHMYFTEQLRGQDADVYVKGAWVLHTLRYLIGDDPFRTVLRRMAYPTVAAEQATDGSSTRLVTSADVIDLTRQTTGLTLDWFFDLYLRHPELPELQMTRSGETVTLHWLTPNDLPFPMPVDVLVGEERRRFEMPNGTAVFTVPPGKPVVIDPKNWLLKTR